MRFAFVLFNNMTALDLIGAYDPLTRLKSMGGMPDLTWDFCALTPTVQDDRGMSFEPTKVGQSLAAYDLLVVPGGFGTRTLMHDLAFIDWMGTAAPVVLKASVCTGALLLGAAGFLQGKRATTHPNAYSLLAPFCAEVVTDGRVVDAGPVVTSRGVTASVDLGLSLVQRLAGKETRQQIQKQVDYPFFQEWGGDNA